ncbi:helix-turn-helix transcriptional regulator [Desertimonas flava]|uniref:helix-turn-helix transcriptional regulator n=1 Tax=Desertimonas flava TaxID=2064846 RepID=UPI0013C45F4C|nr:BREX system ATP-binding domain-containing protein [Desertimonas flava]
MAANAYHRCVSADDRIVGRRTERARLTELVERAVDGHPCHGVVHGVAGSGKTTMLSWTVSLARERGFDVVDVHVRGEGLPLGDLRAAFPDVTGVRTHLELLESVRDRLESSAAERPVLVAVDNLDSADRATAHAVLYLVRHLRHHRVLVVATCRDERMADDLADHVRRLTDGGRARDVHLDMFGEDDVAELVGVRSGIMPHTGFVSMIRDRTGGLPFYAVELLDVLLAAGVDPASTLVAARARDLALPRRVTTAVLHRVFEQGADARLVAAAASVLGSTTLDRLGLLGELTGLDVARTGEAFDALVRSLILVPDEATFRFAHAIVREALYADLDPAVRRRWHSRAADLLARQRSASRPDAVLEIAGHLRRGSGGRDPDAARLLRDAGDAVVYDDPRAAADWYRDALGRLAPSNPSVPSLQLSLGHALDLSGHHDEAARVTVAALRALGPGPERERGALIASRAAAASARFELAAMFVDAALSGGNERGVSPSRLLVQRGWVRFWQGQLVAAAQDLADARSLAVGDADPEADALDMQLCFQRGDALRGSEIAGRLRARLDGLAAPARHCVQSNLRVVAAFELDPAAALVDADGIAPRSAMADWHHACLAVALWRQGRLADAQRTIEQAAAASRDAPSGFAASVIHAVQIGTRAELGDHDGAERFRQRARSSSRLVLPSLVDCAVARLHVVRGEPGLALTVLDGAARRERDVGRVNLLTAVLAEVVDAAVAAGRRSEAIAANAEMQKLPDDGANLAATVRRAISAAVAERDPEAARRARVCAVRHQLASDAARAALLLGQIEGDPEQILLAHDEFAVIGAVERQRDAARLIRQHRGGPRRRRLQDGELSDDDHAIARLVADGLSNRQIARRMSFSPKTIEVYLSRIYAKTGCRSRVELAVAVQRDELVGARRGRDGT